MNKRDEASLDEALWKIWAATEPDTDAVRNGQGRRRLERYIWRQKLTAWTRRAAGAVAVSVCLVLMGAAVYRWVLPAKTEQPTCFVLATSPGSPGEFELPDGTCVWLNVASRLEYTSDFIEGDTREVKLTGEGFFKVRRDTLRPFTVQLAHIGVEVLGTEFDVRSYAGEPTEDVVLLRGAVRVDGRHIDVTLSPDERYCYDISSAVGTVSEADASSYCQWFEPKLVFDNVPLGDILVNIGRRYGVSVTTGASIDYGKRLSLTVIDEPVTEVMDVLCSLVGASYMIDENNIVLNAK